MTPEAAGADDHPWYVDLRPDPAVAARDSDAFAAFRALDAIGATVLAVHAETLPTLADIVGGRCYVGFTILIPGSVERGTIEDITATVGAGYRATIAPGHPLPPVEQPLPSPTTRHRVERHTALPSGWPQALIQPVNDTASPLAKGA